VRTTAARSCAAARWQTSKLFLAQCFQQHLGLLRRDLFLLEHLQDGHALFVADLGAARRRLATRRSERPVGTEAAPVEAWSARWASGTRRPREPEVSELALKVFVDLVLDLMPL